jgi:hypothetical protein
MDGAEEGEAFAGELFGGVGEFAPDAAEFGDLLHVGVEGFDGDAAVVAGFAEGFKEGRPGNEAAAGDAALAFAGVDVADVRAGGADSADA